MGAGAESAWHLPWWEEEILALTDSGSGNASVSAEEAEYTLAPILSDWGIFFLRDLRLRPRSTSSLILTASQVLNTSEGNEDSNKEDSCLINTHHSFHWPWLYNLSDLTFKKAGEGRLKGLYRCHRLLLFQTTGLAIITGKVSQCPPCWHSPPKPSKTVEKRCYIGKIQNYIWNAIIYVIHGVPSQVTYFYQRKGKS